MSDEEQANLSEREIHLNTIRQLREAKITVPNELAMFGVRINKYTVIYYVTAERRQNMVSSLREMYGDDINIEFIDPRRK